MRRHEELCRRFKVCGPEAVTDDMIRVSIIPYLQLCECANVPWLYRNPGPFLAEIAEWCECNGWPPLNSLAVRKEYSWPGYGYDTAAACDWEKWYEQVKCCIACSRYPSADEVLGSAAHLVEPKLIPV